MEELFADISEEDRKNAQAIFEIAMYQSNVLGALNVLIDYTRAQKNERLKEFLEFYFSLRLMEYNK